MEKITLTPIGFIHSPYKDTKDIPIQGKFKPKVKAYVKLKSKYAPGLKDLDGFSHAIILYFFHKSRREDILGKPFLEDKEHGIFAIRSPHRPNHIGLSVVRIEGIKADELHFSGVDMLDGTPVLDIKPYIKHFDMRDDISCGWLDKHFS